MDDPLSLLMASRGMPLGLTLKLKSGEGGAPAPDRWAGQRQRPGGQERRGGGCSARLRPCGSPAAALRALRPQPVPPAGVPARPRPLPPARRRRDQLQRSEQRVADRLSELARSIGSNEQAAEQLQQMLASPGDKDSWGTTRKSAAEIAKQIADSNAGARRRGPPPWGLWGRCSAPVGGRPQARPGCRRRELQPGAALAAGMRPLGSRPALR
jgi:hypothetical protein